ncbi:beta-ketoacyl synthase N-terminal-like domain-containing protein [Streptomyces sp. DG2A-72]|uniref:type I polyketide synthase n=1 Tax=Streptomyces sp. DG2A-72 TaxID=3051386 RepID=UPI00265C2AF4|nr:beta-ketoacyl synthase N-terminal-like domain-containing protein [Streptomyces sp. DG2A-72]MDO0931746.1 beta-ketoacyl synthase N-terminal-like domain-containing protein [Streptomyces sp. DG2A-72]
MSAVAVTGLDCRFPGAEDPYRFWELLIRGGDGISRVPRERWDPGVTGGPGEGGFLADADAFDNAFFTITPREAASMDPQQRLMLQCAWRAFEDAGVAPHRLAGTATGVFVGVMGSEWAQLTLTDLPGITPQIGSGNGYCMIANRVSYHLDLKGPCLAVDTACSSSLVAVHLAVNALLSGECDRALAGGVNIALTPALGLFYERAGLAAPDGRCKPFSAGANGIGRGEGVGAVVLRRLEDALADGDHVYAVIRGTAVNQDGRSNGLTAPSRWSQQEVMAAAFRRAGVEPGDVVFTEGHGTGTALGDMIEAKALGAWHAGRARPMALGSVKGNLGHTEGAAGIAGLIKVALALHHRTVPVSRFAAHENPGLRLAEKGLRLLKSPLRLSGPALAGLSSFGMGGTNAHAVLESAPSVRTTASAPPALGAHVFTLTAPDAPALRRNLAAQAEAIGRRQSPVGPLCRASHRVKSGHAVRAAVVVGAEEGSSRLAEALRDERPMAAQQAPLIAALFTGQGAQFPTMGAQLYRSSSLYRRHLDAADAALLPYTETSVRDLLLRGDPAVHRTRWAQPALFAVGYALGAALADAGVRPALLLGHSVGEFAAAVHAEALSLADAARLIAARGALMEQLPDGGGMLAVHAPADRLHELVEREPLVGFAAFNGPRSTVLSGDLAALDRIASALDGVRVRRLEVSHAFHSPLMRPVLEPFHRIAEETAGGVPRIPFYSTVRGKVLESEPLDAAYWTEHISAPVLFADAAAQLLDERPTHVVELGPRPVLTALARRIATGHPPVPLHPLPGEAATGTELAATVAALYRAGLDVDWPAQDEGPTRQLLPYTFATDGRFWRGGLPTPPPPVIEAEPEEVSRTDSIEIHVLEAVAGLGGYDVSALSPHSRPQEDLGLDSVTLIELKARVEARLPSLGPLPVEELLGHLSTLGDLIAYVTARAAQGGVASSTESAL